MSSGRLVSCYYSQPTTSHDRVKWAPDVSAGDMESVSTEDNTCTVVLFSFFFNYYFQFFSRLESNSTSLIDLFLKDKLTNIKLANKRMVREEHTSSLPFVFKVDRQTKNIFVLYSHGLCCVSIHGTRLFLLELLVQCRMMI